MNKNYVLLLIVGVLLSFTWFEVRPTYLRYRCETRAREFMKQNFTYENIMAQKALHVHLKEDFYQGCLRYWGIEK